MQAFSNINMNLPARLTHLTSTSTSSSSPSSSSSSSHSTTTTTTTTSNVTSLMMTPDLHPSFKGKSFLDKPIHKPKTMEISLSVFAFVFSEWVQYTQKNVHGIQDLEKQLNGLGYRVGQKVLELSFFREKGWKRETRLLPLLILINASIWKSLFGKPADSLEKSSEHNDEYMISDNDLLVNKFVSIPKDLSQLNTGAYVAGLIEAILDGSGFPARVTAHTVPIEGYPYRTTILIKFDSKVIEREKTFV